MENLPCMLLHYEHVQESAYVRLHVCELLTKLRSHTNTMCNFERGGATKLIIEVAENPEITA